MTGFPEMASGSLKGIFAQSAESYGAFIHFVSPQQPTLLLKFCHVSCDSVSWLYLSPKHMLGFTNKWSMWQSRFFLCSRWKAGTYRDFVLPLQPISLTIFCHKGPVSIALLQSTRPCLDLLTDNKWVTWIFVQSVEAWDISIHIDICFVPTVDTINDILLQRLNSIALSQSTKTCLDLLKDGKYIYGFFPLSQGALVCFVSPRSSTLFLKFCYTA